ncbi:polysaccharide pyruvyl transferase family protein, partial [Acinetobacter brisouii]|uniref:polysaccharide pyruvyl transferase family protein n=1 Tax=Acinetobacter brisouii TaxID=396323 RepID=UPI00124FE5E6
IEILYFLKKMNINEGFFDEFTHICFNGEGAVHYKSGHLIRFLGLLYLAKYKNKKVASINQTVDLNNNIFLTKALVQIYNSCDFVSVREPISYELLKNCGLNSCKIIPDAVYGLPILKDDFISETVKKYNLEYKNYITMTGSSFLDRNNKSIKFFKNIIEFILQEFKNKKIIFLSNAKTDFYLINKILTQQPNLKEMIEIIDSHQATFSEAMALIASSKILVGGRQHPNIFAFIYKTPYLPLEGNTFKNLGVAKLQDYPIEPLSWSTDYNNFRSKIEEVLELDPQAFKNLSIEKFNIFG